MSFVKNIRLIIFFAAFVFIAKPFIGFGLSARFKSPVVTNILAKAFSKRKIEDCHSVMNDIQKSLSSPLTAFFLRFAVLLAILFPFTFKAIREITRRFLRELHLSLFSAPITLCTSQLLI